MKTTIDHDVRFKLRLNCLEYCILDYLSGIKFDGDTNSALEASLFIAPNLRMTMLDDLMHKGFLMHTDISKYAVTDKWHNAFKVDANLIDVLWKVHPAGSKVTCRERLPKVLKKIGIDELKVKLEAYLKACKESNSYAKNLDTWLNPKTEHWLDPLPIKREFKQGQQETKVTAVNYKIKKLS